MEKFIGVCMVFYPSPWFSFPPFLAFPPLIPPFLLPNPSLNRLLFALPPAGHHFNSFLGGSSLSMSSPACSPLQAAWMDHSLSAAEELKPHRPPIYCHLLSHDRWLSIPFTMSPHCLDSLHCNLLDLGHGSPGSMNFLLNVVGGVGSGRLQGIPWHELPLIRAFVKERLALTAFFSCNCSYPSASWGTGSHVDTSPFREDRLDKVLGCLCSGWQKDALGTLYCSNSLSVSAL